MLYQIISTNPTLIVYKSLLEIVQYKYLFQSFFLLTLIQSIWELTDFGIRVFLKGPVKKSMYLFYYLSLHGWFTEESWYDDVGIV